MEGCREQYLSNKAHVHAMFAEYLENTLLLPDQLQHETGSTPSSLIISSIVDNDFLLPPVANICVASSMPNANVCDDLYICDDIEFLL